MSSFEERLGWFWLPETPSDRVAGLLTTRPEGVELQLVGSFEADGHEPVFFPGKLRHAVIHGLLVNPRESVSILGAQLMLLSEHEWSYFDSNAVLGGLTADDGYLALRHLGFSLSGLALMFPRSAVTAIVFDPEAPGAGDRPGMRVDATQLPPMTADLGNGIALTILSGFSASWSEGATLADSQTCAVTSTDLWSVDDALNTARRLRDICELMTCAPQQLTNLSYMVDLDDPGSREELHFPALERTIGETPDHLSAQQSLLLSGRDLLLGTVEDSKWDFAMDHVLRGWIEWHTRNADAVANVLRPHRHAEPTPREQFLSAFEAVETYAEIRFGKKVDNAEHAARVAAVLDALPDDLAEKAWAEKALPSKRGKGQARLLNEVIEATASSHILIPDPKDFVEKVVRIRGSRAHGGTGGNRKELIRLSRCLRALLILAYLSDAGRPPEISNAAATAMAGRTQP